MKSLWHTKSGIAVILAIFALAGIHKFNYLAGLPSYDEAGI